MDSGITIRALEPDDVDAYLDLRSKALRDAPLAFAASPGDDFVGDSPSVRAYLARWPDSAIFGAFDPDLVGTVGIMRHRHVKAAHKMIVWGMFVEASQRGKGVGRSLIDAVIAHARTVDGVSRLYISVTSDAGGALRLYERAGFRIWGTEPDSLRHDGRSVEEHHLAMELVPMKVST